MVRALFATLNMTIYSHRNARRLHFFFTIANRKRKYMVCIHKTYSSFFAFSFDFIVNCWNIEKRKFLWSGDFVFADVCAQCSSVTVWSMYMIFIHRACVHLSILPALLPLYIYMNIHIGILYIRMAEKEMFFNMNNCKSSSENIRLKAGPVDSNITITVIMHIQ